MNANFQLMCLVEELVAVSIYSGGSGSGGGGCRLHTKCILLKRTFQNVVMNKPWTRHGREATLVW